MARIDFADGWMPLTLPQLDFWEEFSFHPDQPVSTVAHCVEIEGDVDVEKLLRAISQTVREAEVLSIRFSDEKEQGRPVQLCDPAHMPDVDFVDLSAFPDPRAGAGRRMETDLSAPLDLRRDRMSAHALYRIGARQYIWYIRAHHIIIDGYGLALIEQRCGQLYSHFCGQGESGHPFHPFASFIHEEDAYRASPRWEADRKFWQDYLDGPVRLPILDRGAEDYGEAGYHHDVAFRDDISIGRRAMAKATDIGWPDLLVLLSGLYLSRMLPMQGKDEGLTLWLPFSTPQFAGCRVAREVLANGPGDGFNLTYRADVDGAGLTLKIEAASNMMDAQTFARIAAGLPAFLKASLAPHLIERPVSDLRRRLP
ncbi:condensation domain-containing protein [Brucella neotomae]|nr:condensation domain-containing protein [Brucella neotomae]KEY00582.1 condensation protein [Brucella neotomae 5K33]KFJ57819.1 condensation domain protein [Brucella neotomae 5K33]SPU66747.1 enterobactin synthetase subunit F [Brucella neotomae]SPU68099.1 enterobactin synthetase subunit F [Brucella neotomae]SUW61113.1 enterobactin synthetase subunit F [Brucella neotomae]